MTLNKNTCPHLHVYRIPDSNSGGHIYMCKSCDTKLLVMPKEEFYGPGLASTIEDQSQTHSASA